MVLNKSEFHDALRIRYGLRLDNLPSTCVCGTKFDIAHALQCKKGGFISQRHDDIKNMLAVCLGSICKNVTVEPDLIPVSNETFRFKSANVEKDARLDIKANGFYRRGQTAFFDVRIVHVNAESYKEKETKTIFSQNENEKKRTYLERVLNIEHGTFTPLIFGTNGGYGKEAGDFLKILANKISEKGGEQYATITAWLRAKLSFEILKSALLCIRGSRTIFKKSNCEDYVLDFHLNAFEADIRV